jgi:hypothetical protein
VNEEDLIKLWIKSAQHKKSKEEAKKKKKKKNIF